MGVVVICLNIIPAFYLEGMRKTTQNVSQVAGRVVQIEPEYKIEVLELNLSV